MNELNRQKQLQSAKEQSDRKRAQQDTTSKKQTRSQQALSKSTISFADALSSYILPIASTTSLGGIKVGSNLTIDINGVLNASGGAGATNWGLIGGTLTDQTDLVTALGLKANTSHTLEGHTATVTDGKFLKGTGVNTFAWEDHGLSASDVGAIADPGSSEDYEILTWNGTTGNAVRTSVGVKIDSNYNLVGDADIVAYQSGSYTGSIWDGLPVDNLTLKYTTGILSIKPNVIGNAGKYLKVSAGETALEWADAATVDSQWIDVTNGILYYGSTNGERFASIENTYSGVSVQSSLKFGFNTASADPAYLGKIMTEITNRSAGTEASNMYIYTTVAGVTNSKISIVGNYIGLGVSPQKKLHLAESINGETSMLIHNSYPGASVQSSVAFGFNTAAADPAYLGKIITDISNRGSGTEATNMYFQTTVAGTLATRLAIQDGNIGIGTISPATYLDGVSGLAIYGNGGLSIANASGHYLQYMVGTDLRWYNGTADKMTLTNSGNLQIGATTILYNDGHADFGAYVGINTAHSSSYNLKVGGNIGATGDIIAYIS